MESLRQYGIRVRPAFVWVMIMTRFEAEVQGEIGHGLATQAAWRRGEITHRRSAWSPEQRLAWMRDGIEVQLCEGEEDLEVVGEAGYQDNLWRIVGGRRSPEGRMREDIFAVLAAEPDNPYDANAVAVWIQGLKVGYLSREDARQYRSGLLALEQQHDRPIALAGVIAGGGMRADGPGRLGVFLEHDPADFGLRPIPVSPPSGSRMRTGLSDALATDEADDSYDLRWMSDLPVDDLRAIKLLRQLLERETDALDRHFMHTHLQALLYRSREVFASALDEYDQACQQHDAEMDSIRAAFMAKWGQVPVLELYRQMASASRRPSTLSRRCGGRARYRRLRERLCAAGSRRGLGEAGSRL